MHFLWGRGGNGGTETRTLWIETVGLCLILEQRALEWMLPSFQGPELKEASTGSRTMTAFRNTRHRHDSSNSEDRYSHDFSYC